MAVSSFLGQASEAFAVRFGFRDAKVQNADAR